MGIVRRQKGNIMKHTPGKWNVTRTRATEDTHHHEVLARDTEYHREVVICECFPINDDGQIDSESAANARLIAAAPELLEALKIALHRADQARYHTAEELGPITAEWLDGIITYARAAITKAER